jgi:F0F1-type ATP synthase gamma subunit
MEGKLTKAQRLSGVQLEERLVVFELSQKASSIYDAKSPEQKRIIIKHLFSELQSTEDSVTVRYNKYVSTIAQKVRLTRVVLGGGASTRKA